MLYSSKDSQLFSEHEDDYKEVIEIALNSKPATFSVIKGDHGDHGVVTNWAFGGTIKSPYAYINTSGQVWRVKLKCVKVHMNHKDDEDAKSIIEGFQWSLDRVLDKENK